MKKHVVCVVDKHVVCSANINPTPSCTMLLKFNPPVDGWQANGSVITASQPDIGTDASQEGNTSGMMHLGRGEIHL